MNDLGTLLMLWSFLWLPLSLVVWAVLAALTFRAVVRLRDSGAQLPTKAIWRPSLRSIGGLSALTLYLSSVLTVLGLAVTLSFEWLSEADLTVISLTVIVFLDVLTVVLIAAFVLLLVKLRRLGTLRPGRVLAWAYLATVLGATAVFAAGAAVGLPHVGV